MNTLERFKFRAWDKTYQCMHTGLPIDMTLRNPQIYIVMQSANVHDKNGTLVFEGDYLSDGENLWEVRYHVSHCGFYAIAIAGPESVDDTVFSLWHLCNRHNAERLVEVVGNIYEHRESLRKLIRQEKRY